MSAFTMKCFDSCGCLKWEVQLKVDGNKIVALRSVTIEPTDIIRFYDGKRVVPFSEIKDYSISIEAEA